MIKVVTLSTDNNACRRQIPYFLDFFPPSNRSCTTRIVLISKFNPTLEQCPHNNEIHMRWVGLQVQKFVSSWYRGWSSALQSLEGWRLILQQRFRPRQLRSLLAATRTLCRGRAHFTIEWYWSRPHFVSRPRIVPASWQALKFIVPGINTVIGILVRLLQNIIEIILLCSLLST